MTNHFFNLSHHLALNITSTGNTKIKYISREIALACTNKKERWNKERSYIFFFLSHIFTKLLDFESKLFSISIAKSKDTSNGNIPELTDVTVCSALSL